MSNRVILLSPLEHTTVWPLMLRSHTLGRRLEVFVGLATFTSCIVAVDKLFLFYACTFYKVMSLLDRQSWEPTLRYPDHFKRGAKHPKVLVQLPMFNETHVAARIIDYACKMDYPRDKCVLRLSCPALSTRTTNPCLA